MHTSLSLSLSLSYSLSLSLSLPLSLSLSAVPFLSVSLNLNILYIYMYIYIRFVFGSRNLDKTNNRQLFTSSYIPTMERKTEFNLTWISDICPQDVSCIFLGFVAFSLKTVALWLCFIMFSVNKPYKVLLIIVFVDMNSPNHLFYRCKIFAPLKTIHFFKQLERNSPHLENTGGSWLRQ